MWADALLRAEQLHLLRVLAWAGLSVVAGTALVVVAAIPRSRAAVLRGLGTTLLALGIVEGLVAGASYRSATLTDAAGAARLQNLVWFQLGLFLGCAIAGVLLAALARRARMPAVAGAAIALLVHGAALTAVTAAFVPIVSR
jgi:hypothetical protein